MMNKSDVSIWKHEITDSVLNVMMLKITKMIFDCFTYIIFITTTKIKIMYLKKSYGKKKILNNTIDIPYLFSFYNEF